MVTDDEAMSRALELAAAAQEWGDTPIGAVVLGRDGTVLAEAEQWLRLRARTPDNRQREPRREERRLLILVVASFPAETTTATS